MKSYQLAQVIGISQGSLSDIENNKSLPSADTLAKLFKYTNLNVIWLLTGSGPIRKGSGPLEGETEYTVNEDMSAYGDDKQLRELMEKLARIYNQGDNDKKAHLIGFLTGADPGF